MPAEDRINDVSEAAEGTDEDRLIYRWDLHMYETNSPTFQLPKRIVVQWTTELVETKCSAGYPTCSEVRLEVRLPSSFPAFPLG